MEKFIKKLMIALTVMFLAIICGNGAVKAGGLLGKQFICE